MADRRAEKLGFCPAFMGMIDECAKISSPPSLEIRVI
jgi:hypothetical protein